MWQDTPCILMFDCNDKEAEGGCWQGDGTFRQGLFQVDGRCIAISSVNQPSSWSLENRWCQERGGQLVSLTTQNMKDRLPKWLQRLNLNGKFFIGLMTMPKGLSPMYQHSLQWVDKTVAHTSNTRYSSVPRGFNVLNCHAPSDEVSSCDDLLRSNLYRVALAIFASLSLLGNVGTLLYRLIFHKTTGDIGYDVFVTNLCVADFLMGVYLLVIGVADYRYRGSYLWEDVDWRNSGLCKVTGVVCLLSMEVSVFMIFLITTDRFLVLRFPFSSFHFRKRSAQLTCGLVWLAGLTLAVTPCLPVTSHWQFYSQTSICIPLPTSRVDFPGRKYSFIIIVVLNFICFLVIFVGQVLIYWSIRATSMSVSSTSKATKDITVARRLITVVMSEFLCWFPVGLTGILATYDIPVSGEVNVAMAIFILPVNSALNPFLYTFNIYLERRRRTREVERQKHIICQLKVDMDCSTAGCLRPK
ncbi:G-protein coupled receptor GRL101-like [Pomacea canaliculata]|uniref:G-protein coupled receptor GRL101-like n=1 Tax=Pomacea canaliculata TaxID=400727 RepID=UPI000D728C80|nr:G-protein coupled receptor GRL101-like [Pomacea canaliculata]